MQRTDGLPGPVIVNRFGKPATCRPRKVFGPSSHTSLNWPGGSLDHGKAKGWLAAQKADDEFISTYAKDSPTREDIAESFLTWIVVRHRSDRVSKSHVKKILKAIPNRIKYFDEEEFDMYPIVSLK